MNELYTEIILDYFKNPKNKGEISNATHTATELNPTCGDKVTIYLKTDAQGKIQEATFTGEGCAISQAATSMLTEILIGKTIEEAAKIQNEEIYDLLKVPISPGRVKCALLGLVATKSATK